jgi:2-amino-4-hydroxy-6-hydroxymethyldihydropteridine diphosphokinase
VAAFIGLGGNLDESRKLIAAALERLDAEAGVRLLRRSADYRTPPWGEPDQPDFVNAVAELETTRSPVELLQLLLAVERALGRRRGGRRWGPRCIDLDLLTYDELEISEDGLELPHPRMHLRAFVLVPLLELEPNFVISGRGAATECLRAIDAGEVAAVRRLEPPGVEEQTS